jgi:uridylate kinase
MRLRKLGKRHVCLLRSNGAKSANHLFAEEPYAIGKRPYCYFRSWYGNPYFTTDTAASLRAIEINADAVLKGTVWMVFTPQILKRSYATKFEEISFTEVYEKGLNVMDMTAFTLCQENKLPIIVFDMNKPGNLLKLANGEHVGTVVK